ncbi:hypothetical protein TD95_004958 [Thielaviopsis punctulata]|uniref:Uncharacterized protein n=1 Tax=Thielaviopsis punctulata TaxID=72032 RepID=A0A0F4ZKQ0_9PEZI|nr:hypothetical protein TD95_004958 [Thielaviopsis punctulata]
MSSRQLRKLRERQEQEARARQEAQGGGISEHDASDDEPVQISQPRQSLFAALGDDDDGGDDDGDEEAESEHNQPVETEAVVKPEGTSTAAEASQKNKKKKKNRNKKKRKNKPGQPKDDDAKTATSTNPAAAKNAKGSTVESEDEIDRALRELNMTVPSATPASVHTHTINRLFAISPKHLKERNEMIAVFGRDVINATAQEEQAARPLPRPGDAATLEDVLRGLPGQKLPDITLRRNVFIDGKESWPRASAGGLMMEKVEENAAEQWTEYRFTGDVHFGRVKEMFYGMAMTGDSNSMIASLRNHPYHIMYLLQCYLIARDHDKNQALAADLTQRALFTFGRVSLSSFKKDVESGRARLDFARPENRRFFLAGYRNVRALVQKGAYRTAFEWAKLLMAFEPEEDVYGMNHVVHMLAVRSHNSEWLEEFLGFIKDRPEVKYSAEHAYYKHSLVPGLVQRGKTDEARDLLVANIESMPWLYCRLFQVLDLDAVPAVWGVKPPTDSDELYTELYVTYAKDLWLAPELKELLSSAGGAANKGAAQEKTWVAIDLRTTRFIYLENNTELMGLLPAGALAVQPNYDFDPLPPAEAENILADATDRWPWEEARPNADNPLTAGGIGFANLGGVGELARRLLMNVRNMNMGAGGGQAGMMADEAAIAALLDQDEDNGNPFYDEHAVDEGVQGGEYDEYDEYEDYDDYADFADEEEGRYQARVEDWDEDEDDGFEYDDY